jgi:hypothetical protein
MKYNELSDNAKENAVYNVSELLNQDPTYDYYYAMSGLESALDNRDLNDIKVDVNENDADKLDVSFAETPINDELLHMINSYNSGFGDESNFFGTLDSSIKDKHGWQHDNYLDNVGDFLKEYCSVSFDSNSGAKFSCSLNIDSPKFDELKHQVQRSIEDWMSEWIDETETDIITSREKSSEIAYDMAREEVDEYEFDENGNIVG